MKYEKPNIRFEDWGEDEEIFTDVIKQSLEDGGEVPGEGEGPVNPWDGDNMPDIQW